MTDPIDSEQTPDGRWINVTEAEGEEYTFRVSTVELPIPHGPNRTQHYETCVFWECGSCVVERYTSREGAIGGHKRVVQAIRNRRYAASGKFEVFDDD